MAARGAVAKQEIIKKLSEAFGEDFIGEVDKKVYIWQNDGGERVQIALALTCPKVFIDVPDGAATANSKKEDWDFSDNAIKKAEPVKKAEITEEEKQRIADIMKSLGL